MGILSSKEPRARDDRSIPPEIEQLATRVANELSQSQREMDTAQVASIKTYTQTQANNTLSEWAILMQSNALEALDRLKVVHTKKSQKVLSKLTSA